MAELNISELWSKGKQLDAKQVLLDVESAIKGKSRDTLRWVKIILWIEFGLNVAFTPLVYMWWEQIGLTWEFYIFLGIVIGYLGYYLFLIRAISNFDYTGHVLQSLKKIYGYLNFYLLHYKFVIWVIYPLSFVYGLVVGLQQSEKPLSEIGLQKWLAIVGISIVFVAIMVLLLNWLVNLIYGKKIRRLKGMVSELENADD